ncbi:hypothetical protein HPP92_008310 [Vanilla planifolia]|uniref:acyl-CoA hydrolase n=1 Tax=Vanilla planifolia TaxID=51239 RepID=A0A835R625_VANPL|nr:hypothetical protein HPP92_008310 [Vanilla planifolia]
MDRDAVIEFLSQVPLLQRLPSSSIRKIAEIVQVRHYEKGEYVVREGEVSDALYIIWDGWAEVSASVNTEEGNHPEFQLKKYDYFGYDGAVHQVNVIALSKMTCLVLPNGNGKLLKPKSIWNADGTPNDFSLVENILHLESIEALAAACKTVDCLKLVHSFHVYFILIGDINAPILYQVHRVRDGNSFATRRIEAKQRGVVIFTLLASFQKEELGFEHQEVLMPDVPALETLLSMEELREKRLTDPRLPMHYRNTAARRKFVPWPVEIRFCEVKYSTKQSKASLNYWFKARGKLSDDQALHRCVVAYASDLMFADVTLHPHRQKGLKTSILSLDHSMWFHRLVKADEWTLFVIESPLASSGRGIVCGRMYNRNGELMVSLTQEALIRKAKTNQRPKPKL